MKAKNTVYCKSFEVKNFVVAKLKSNWLENIHGCMVVLYGQSFLHRLLHWKSSVVTDQFPRTVKLFHMQQFAIYGVYTQIPSSQ